MSDVGLKITVSADVQKALRGMTQLTDATGELAVEGVGNITAVNEALKELRSAQADVGNTQDLKLVNRAIKDLSSEATKLKRVGTEGFDELGNKIQSVGKKAEEAEGKVSGFGGKAFSAIRNLANILPGVGISGIFGIIGAGLLAAAQNMNLFKSSLYDTAEAEKKAEENAKHLAEVLKGLKDATDVTDTSVGDQEGNIDRVRALARAIQDTTKTYQERKNALEELQKTNKAYFGDLTLEASSLQTLANRINEYSQALINEAVIKGQVEEIANVSKELTKQVKVLDALTNARTRAEIAVKKQGPIHASAGNVASGGPGIDNNKALADLDEANNAFNKQRDAVLDLRTHIAEYRGELNKAIDEQIKFKPLNETTKKSKDALTSLEAVLRQIAAINKELGEADKRPLFQRLSESADISPQVKLIQVQIRDAIKKGATEGAKDPELRTAFNDLAKILGQKLLKLENPILLSNVDFTLADPEDAVKASQKIESAVLKQFGKPIELKQPIGIKAEFEAFDTKEIGINLSKAIQQAAKEAGNIDIFLPNIRAQIEKAGIQDQLDKQLGEALNPDRLLKSIESSGFADIGKSIGDALAQGASPIAAAGKSLFTALGGLISDIGKYLIEYGVAKQFLDTALSAGIALPGFAAIGLGIAAEAIGALVKNVGSSYHAFATGGIVTGPTMGLVGEAGPEVIFPLNQLNRFVQGAQGRGSQDVNVRGQISGNNIKLVLARANKNQNLV